MLDWLLIGKYVGDVRTGVGECLGEFLVTGWQHAEEWNLLVSIPSHNTQNHKEIIKTWNSESFRDSTCSTLEDVGVGEGFLNRTPFAWS